MAIVAPATLLAGTGAGLVIQHAWAGSTSDNSPPTMHIDLSLYNLRALPFLQNADSVLIDLARLPDSGEAELVQPEFLDEMALPIADDGSASTTLPPLALHEGLVLSIGSAARGRVRKSS